MEDNLNEENLNIENNNNTEQPEEKKDVPPPSDESLPSESEDVKEAGEQKEPAAVEQAPAPEEVSAQAPEKEEEPEKVEVKEESAPEEKVESPEPVEGKVEDVVGGETEAQPAANEVKTEDPTEVSEAPVAPEVAEEKVEEVPKEEGKPAVVGDRKWYVIQALTGQEERVKQSIELTIKKESLQNRVFQVLVPTEEIIEIKGGKRIEKIKKMFPGYVFLEMVLDEESWYFIRQTTGVARFIGTKVKPTPVSGKEMQRVLKQLGREERLEINFEKGEGVRIISGAFRGYTGTVDDVNAGKGKLKVLVNIFGRDTPVEVNLEHAQKLV